MKRAGEFDIIITNNSVVEEVFVDPQKGTSVRRLAIATLTPGMGRITLHQEVDKAGGHVDITVGGAISQQSDVSFTVPRQIRISERGFHTLLKLTPAHPETVKKFRNQGGKFSYEN